MRKTLLALALAAAAMPMIASAQQAPIGKWTTIDDETGKPLVDCRVEVARTLSTWEAAADEVTATNVDDGVARVVERWWG